jgi:hypothetical protein
MLIEFQQALADLTASPALCVRVLEEPSLLKERYGLTDREWHRLVGIAQHPGMACACMVYRANRLAPLALNIPETCRALGKQLRAVVSEYWRLCGTRRASISADTGKAVLENAAVGTIPATSLAVPATLHASLMARLDRLGPTAKEIAQVGAAIGRDFSLHCLYEPIEVVWAPTGSHRAGPAPRVKLAMRGGTPTNRRSGVSTPATGLAFGERPAPATRHRIGVSSPATGSAGAIRPCRERGGQHVTPDNPGRVASWASRLWCDAHHRPGDLGPSEG